MLVISAEEKRKSEERFGRLLPQMFSTGTICQHDIHESGVDLWTKIFLRIRDELAQ